MHTRMRLGELLLASGLLSATSLKQPSKASAAAA